MPTATRFGIKVTSSRSYLATKVRRSKNDFTHYSLILPSQKFNNFNFFDGRVCRTESEATEVPKGPARTKWCSL